MQRKGIEMQYGPRTVKFAAIITMLVVAMLLFGGCAAETAKPFSIVALPDTQFYSRAFPEVFMSQTRWIAENKNKLNIKFVAHEGDIVDINVEPDWENADKAMSLLDGVVPYAFAVGNHDIGHDGTRLFNTYFPVSRYEKYAWYGGHFGDDNTNSYCLFEAGGMKFMVVSLIYYFEGHPELLAWANDVVSKHPDRRTIVVTHFYLHWDARRNEDAWQKFIKKHENIFMVLCGHIVGPSGEPGAARRVDEGVSGNKVHQILADYQSLEKEGGGGYLRVMKFVPKENKIYVTTYSPYLNKSMIDANNQFVLKYDMTD